MAVVNFYESNLAGDVVAPSTPLDGIATNVLFGNHLANDMFGEAGPVLNYFLGREGDDWMTGGGTGADNVFMGGDGVDTAFLQGAASATVMDIGYTGGIEFDRADTGLDYVARDTEVISFDGGGTPIIAIFAGSTTLGADDIWVQWTAGADLAISQDWIDALFAGQVTATVGNYDGDAFLDTALTGADHINSYVLLDYNINNHNHYAVGYFGEGVLYELG